MQENKLTVQINKPIKEVFAFTITPPNSTRWIPSIIREETNELPIRIGTIYTLQDKDSTSFEVIVVRIQQNEMIEFSKDNNYHCRYTYKSLNNDTTELEYYEWQDTGDIAEPFGIQTLQKLKSVLEE
jgi:uncharacterized protein YndB with AHSA1/START domain